MQDIDFVTIDSVTICKLLTENKTRGQNEIKALPKQNIQAL